MAADRGRIFESRGADVRGGELEAVSEPTNELRGGEAHLFDPEEELSGAPVRVEEGELLDLEVFRSSLVATARLAPERKRQVDGMRNAIREAQKLGITTIALIDTDCDPDSVDLPIPGNDDGIRSIELIVSLLADAIIKGRAEAPTAKGDEDSADKAAEAPATESAEAGVEAAAE